MALAKASSGLSTSREEAAVSLCCYGYLQILYDRFRTLFNIWIYKKEDCSLCRPYFREGSSTSIVLNQTAVSPEALRRCHGCLVVEFAILFCGHIIERKGKNFRFSTCYTQVNIDRTEFILEGEEDRDGTQIRVCAKLEMLKTTRSDKDDTWFQWMLGFLEARLRRHQPRYIERAFETHPVSGYTGSAAAFERIYSWFQICSTSHKACGGINRPPSLPTRVIDITEKNSIRLIEYEDSQSHYICLSHRWMDAKKMPRCTRANINFLKQQIPWDFLTQSFQDAISFAQEFSRWLVQQYPGQGPIRYIWIDSLCIIQDSPEDWDKESKLMCSIYEGAILTVAAASGADGCFSEAEEIFKGFEVSNPQRRNPRFYLRKGLPYHGEPALTRESNVAHAFSGGLDLFTRGWVMQERLLSRRFIIFSPNEIMWECFEISDCECGRLSRRIRQAGLALFKAAHEFGEGKQKEDPNYPMNPISLKVAYHTSLKDVDERRMRNPRDWWRRLVEIFSSMNLTKDSDRLPALMGLATQFGRETGMDNYIIGNWMASLPFDLAWYTDTPASGLLDQDRSHPISSWTWVSCASPVRIPREATPEKFIACAKLNSVSHTLDSRVSLNITCSVFTATTDYISESTAPLVGEYFPDSTSLAIIPANKRIVTSLA
jgi:hypothetical protein